MKTLKDIASTGSVSTVTKVDLTYSKNPATACVIPKGTRLTVHFSQANPSRIYFEYGGFLRAATLEKAHRFFTGFSKPPTLRTLERYDSDGIAKTPTGERTEPDGFAMDGSPSWMMVMSLI